MQIFNKPILVVGDGCCDFWVYCQCTRLCPESPVPVLDVKYVRQNFGMAGNVYRNIIDLEKECFLICNKNFQEISKTRYVELKTNHMFIRIDSSGEYHRIQELNNINFSQFGAVVISDYNKGFLCEEDIQYISNNHSLTFLDTKKVIDSWAQNVTFIKLNRTEYNQSKKFLTPVLESKIIETLGEEGCRYREKIFPVKKVEIKNLSGAGDSFLAGLVVKFVDTNNIEESIKFANEVATIVVQKTGVSTIKD